VSTTAVLCAVLHIAIGGADVCRRGRWNFVFKCPSRTTRA